jgi:hypothetical protein
MKARLRKRLQAVEKRLAPPPRGDLRHDIKVRALAAAFTLDQLRLLRAKARPSGPLEFPPDMAAERDRYVELRDRLSLLLTGKPYAELRGDEIPRCEIPAYLR